MKPDKIILLRHGQSEGNVNKDIYVTKPDYALELTPEGKKQAELAGKEISNLLGNYPIQFYVSPYWRTRQTYAQVKKYFSSTKTYEDPRLREQEWTGGLRDRTEDYKEVENFRDSYGHFYYRIGNGESCADCYDRMSDFLSTLHRDFEKPDFARYCVIVTHGMTLRLFLMRWFHYTVEEFEVLANPKNCEYIVLNLNRDNGRYELGSELRKHKLKHPYQFKAEEL